MTFAIGDLDKVSVLRHIQRWNCRCFVRLDVLSNVAEHRSVVFVGSLVNKCPGSRDSRRNLKMARML